jgi:hypothetical protein
MNKFVIGALALTAASPLSFAGSETKDWSGLDREIENLGASLTAAGPGFAVSGFVRSRFAWSSDQDFGAAPGDQDLTGFNVDNARVYFSGNAGDYGVFISADGAGGGASLLDAFGTFPIFESVKGQMGQFKIPFLWSSLVDDNNLLFLDRTYNGQVFDSRDTGIQVSGAWEQLSWWLALQNGVDGVAEDFQWTARVQFNALGAGTGMQEGAYGASEDSNLTVGVAYTDDGADSGTFSPTDAAVALDVGFASGPFSVHGEIVDYDDNRRPLAGLNFTTGVVTPVAVSSTTGSETPWTVMVGYMITPNEYEIAGRWQDMDDDNNSDEWGIAVNRYVQGHNAKWTLQYTSFNSDDDTIEADTIALGLTVGV